MENTIKSRLNFPRIKAKSGQNVLAISMMIGGIAAVIISAFTGFAKSCEDLPNEVLRLHILANSDSDSDQKTKYELRDFLLADMGKIFGKCEDLSAAEHAAAEALPDIKKKAEDFIRSRGLNYNITAQIVNMYFTTRVYENITMPAGNYKALRIIIGSGKGKNWWCVMYPPLCLPACENNGVYFTEKTSRLIESGGGKIEVRFAVFELFQKIIK